MNVSVLSRGKKLVGRTPVFPSSGNDLGRHDIKGPGEHGTATDTGIHHVGELRQLTLRDPFRLPGHPTSPCVRPHGREGVIAPSQEALALTG